MSYVPEGTMRMNDDDELTLSVSFSYQQPTSPYITHTKYDIWWWKNENWSNNYWRLKVKFSQICSMKSMDSGWENLKMQLALKGLSVRKTTTGSLGKSPNVTGSPQNFKTLFVNCQPIISPTWSPGDFLINSKHMCLSKVCNYNCYHSKYFKFSIVNTNPKVFK